MMWRRVMALATLACLLMLGGLFSASRGTEAQGNRLVWSKVSGASAATDIQDVVMVDTNTAWAVGVEGDAGRAYKLSLQDGQWRVVESQGFASSLRAVAPVTADDVWAVGGNGDGLIVHRDATGWNQIANPVANSQLLTIQMFGDGREGWAGGFYIPGPNQTNRALLLHYTNGHWEQDPALEASSSAGGVITSLHFAGNTGWAVGPGIWKYSNGAWRQESRCNQNDNSPDCFGTFYGVRAINNDEAWTVGIYTAPCPPCNPRPRADHRVNGQWQTVLPTQAWLNPPSFQLYYPNLETVAFPVGDGDHGIAVGSYTLHNEFSEADLRPLLVTYSSGRWSFVNLPVQTGDLNGVSMADATHALVVGNDGLILSYGYGEQGSVYPTPQPSPPIATATPTLPGAGSTPTPLSTVVFVPTPESTPPVMGNPAVRVPDPHLPGVTYFPVVGHTLKGGFRQYWLAHGGLAQFGYPITEEFNEVSPTDGKGYIVQYFERNRFEYHPENRPPYDVLLGLLGRTITAGRESDLAFLPSQPMNLPDVLFFPLTMHNMAPQFSQYWVNHGGLPVYGYPISEGFTEVSPTDGRPYFVQYFERNRLEYHPELPEPFRVSLGLLGVDELKRRGWIH